MDEHATSAMTEIALALSMAFFAILVLALLAMGSGASVPSVALAATAPASSVGAQDVSPGQLVLFRDGRFFDAFLREVSPESFVEEAGLVLAVPPDLPASDMLAVRQRIPAAGVRVTVQDARWRTALEEKKP